jgi:hypothetical protein
MYHEDVKEWRRLGPPVENAEFRGRERFTVNLNLPNPYLYLAHDIAACFLVTR